MDFLIFLLATVGATLIITLSYLFKPVRIKANKVSPVLGKLLKCSQCAGFYIALIIQFIILIHDRNGILFNWIDLYYIIYGFIGSLSSYVTYLFIKPLVDKYD
jgi:hypothetical protein